MWNLKLYTWNKSIRINFNDFCGFIFKNLDVVCWIQYKCWNYTWNMTQLISEDYYEFTLEIKVIKNENEKLKFKSLIFLKISVDKF